ncbi:MAG: RICIN domain-containing protein [Luteolibacter sp.]|uniref:RICIN domain-containing protein n=1 Tax=Luteolibacter sp. TaxID=1962973 RepID=UPI003264B6E7
MKLKKTIKPKSGLCLALGIAFQQIAAGATHPGMLHTNADFTRMAAKVNANAQPWKGSWDLLVASSNSQSTWGPRAVSVINRGTSPDNCALLYNDAAAAYQNALRWKVTGDVAHANKAVEILNAWGYTLTAVTGNADRFLAAGLYGYEIANAAEIMRTYSGWAPADFTQFKTMMVNVFYPLNNQFLLTHNDANIQNYWANWDLSNMASILAIGILCDDQAKIDQAVNYFKTGGGNGSINNAVPILHSPTLGQWQEAGRDQEHSIMGIGLMATICEMAWNQGIDLYAWNNNRFMAGAEYIARYNNLKTVPFSFYSWRSGTGGGSAQTQSVVSNAGQGATRPVWDMIVGHYAQRKGIAIPEVEEKAASTRPDGGPQYGVHGSQFDHLGFTSLTCYRDPIATTVPAGVYQITARHSGKAMAVLNNGTANGTNVDQRTVADTDNQNWTVSSLGSGQYQILGSFSGKALDVSGISTANGANILIWDYLNGNNQKFTFTATDSSYYRLTPVHSGKAVDVANISTADGANIYQWQYLGGTNQQWKFTATSTVRRLRLSTTTNQYLRHSGFRGYIATDPFPAQDSEFRVVPGLAGVTGVSLESINFPGRFLCVRANGETWVDVADGTAAFNTTATFRRVTGLSNTAMYSYQMWGDATRYVINVGGAVNAATVSGTAAQESATFAEVTAQ